MNSRITPYVLPAITFVVFSLLFLFAKPTITGFAVSPQEKIISIDLKITADGILPETALISVILENERGSIEIEKMNVNEFIKKYNVSFVLTEGRNEKAGYEGEGYSGSSEVRIIKDLGKIQSGKYDLITRISYNENLISETKKEIEI
jgi:hypothetical protein